MSIKEKKYKFHNKKINNEIIEEKNIKLNGSPELVYHDQYFFLLLFLYINIITNLLQTPICRYTCLCDLFSTITPSYFH